MTAVSVLGMIHYTLLSARACGFLLTAFTLIIQVIHQNSMQETCLSDFGVGHDAGWAAAHGRGRWSPAPREWGEGGVAVTKMLPNTLASQNLCQSCLLSQC